MNTKRGEKPPSQTRSSKTASPTSAGMKFQIPLSMVTKAAIQEIIKKRIKITAIYTRPIIVNGSWAKHQVVAPDARLMAAAEGYGMVRFHGAFPSVRSLKELFYTP